MKFIFFLLFLIPICVHGSVTVTVNGSNHTIPQTNERGWGNAVTAWIQAISSNTLQPTGGSFTLTSNVDFGPNYGLKAPYYLSRNANPAGAGLFRLSKTDYFAWRNNANTADLLLAIDALDNLIFNGVALPTASSTTTLTNKTIDADSNTISNIANANIKAGAAIARSKLASGTASKVLVNDGSGVMTESSVSSTELGYLSGVTSNIQTQLGTKQDASTAVTLTGTQTLTNKTLTAPTINSPTGLTKSDVGLSNVDNTSDATKNAAVAVLTNKDFDGGTASNSNRLTIPKNTKTNLDSLTRKEGTLVYDTVGAKAYVDNGTSLVAVGSGSGDTSNQLTNGGFEDALGSEWTVTAGSTSSDTTNKKEGNKGLAITLTAVNGTIISQSVTPSAQVSGVNIEHAMWVKTSLTTLQVCALQAGSEVSGSCTNVPANNSWVLVNPIVAGPSSGTVGVRLKSTSSTTGTVYIDDSFVGFARNFGAAAVATDWTTYTPTISATTTAPTKGASINTDVARWRRVGDSMEIQYNYRQLSAGTAGSGSYLISIPSGYTIDSSKTYVGTATNNPIGTFQVGAGTQSGAGVAIAYSTTQIAGAFANDVNAYNYWGSALGPFSNANLDFGFHVTVPIVGWSATQAAVSMNQTGSYTDWTSWTPTGTWSTNTTYSGKWRRIGDSAEYEIAVTTSGAPTAASLTITLPSGHVIDTAKLSSASQASLGSCFSHDAGVAAFPGNVVFASTTTVQPLSINAAGTYGSGTSITNTAPLTFGSGDGVYIRFIAPIVGWSTPSVPVPLLVGSVSSNTTGMERIERARITGAASDSTDCSSSPCTIRRQSGSWVSSATRSAAGTYNLTVTGFSDSPTCTCNGGQTVSRTCRAVAASSTSIDVTLEFPSDTAGSMSKADGRFDIICMGPR